jgi:EAL domain-containing protein (putative c-di-GMP-specific phosphodiesterase class I)
MGAAFTLKPSDYDAMLLMQRADVARHCTKASKDAVWSLFSQSMVESGFFGDSALEDYKENQYDDEISLYFQPVADLVKGQLTSCDVFVRWSCDDESQRDVLLTPENGRIPTNNRKVVYQSCRWMSRWQKTGKSVMTTFVWLPATEFYKDDLDAFLSQCFHDFHISPSSLVIQIDESAVRFARDTAIRQFNKLRDIGVKTAVRGIDRSYTTLDALEGMPLDFVIFHKSVSDSVEKSQERVDHAKKLASEAAEKNLITVFEGVNNQEQAGILKRLGATLVQGRYAGSYASPEDFGRNLSAYAVKNPHHSGTTILDDSALSKGDFIIH